MSSLLRAAGARLAPGLSADELDAVEARFGFSFAPDHRTFLASALPLGDDGRWPDWRGGNETALRDRLAWPVEGLLFDVEHNGLWMPGWPGRPARTDEALALAAEQLAGVPRLVPLYGHRYLPTVPHEAGNPVLSCYQSDIIYYGADLLDWLRREFTPTHPWVPVGETRSVPFWNWFLDE